jgi:phosphatidylinositol alpha-1,6-mannosyltransferase
LGLAGDAPSLRSPGGDTPTVLIVGRMLSAERYKGHDELLEAWPRIVAACGDARLVIVGDGDDRPRLQAKAAALGIDSSVCFTGFVSQARLREHYADGWVFAMPSRGEGFGLVYLEAMSHGLPCIGSIHDAAGEVIDDGVTGYLVDQRDTTAMAERIVQLLRDRSLRAQMGRCSQERFQTHFTYERFRARLLSILEPAFGLPPASTTRVNRPIHRVA